MDFDNRKVCGDTSITDGLVSNCTFARTPSQSSFSSLHSPRKNTATNLKTGIQTFPDDNYQSNDGFWKGWSYYTSSCLQSQLMTKIDSYEKTYSWSPIKFGSKLTHIGFTEKTYSWSSIKLLRISSVTSSTTADAWFLRSKWIIWNVDLTSFLIHYNVFATCWVSGSLWQYQDIGGKKKCLEIKGYPN